MGVRLLCRGWGGKEVAWECPLAPGSPGQGLQGRPGFASLTLFSLFFVVRKRQKTPPRLALGDKSSSVSYCPASTFPKKRKMSVNASCPAESRTCVGAGCAASRCPPSPGGSSPRQGPAATGPIPSVCAGYPPGGGPRPRLCESPQVRTHRTAPGTPNPAHSCPRSCGTETGSERPSGPQGHTGGMGLDRRRTRPAVPDNGHLRRGGGREPQGDPRSQALPGGCWARRVSAQGRAAPGASPPPLPPPPPPPRRPHLEQV